MDSEDKDFLEKEKALREKHTRRMGVLGDLFIQLVLGLVGLPFLLAMSDKDIDSLLVVLMLGVMNH